MLAISHRFWICAIAASTGVAYAEIFSPLSSKEDNILVPNSTKESLTNTYKINYKDSNNRLDDPVIQPPLELKLRSKWQKYDARKKIFIAEGNVIVNLSNAILKADRIEFTKDFNVILATGRVRLNKGNQFFQATQFSYDLRIKEGYLNNVYGILDLEYIDKDIQVLSSPRKKREINSSEIINKFDNYTVEYINKVNLQKLKTENNLLITGKKSSVNSISKQDQKFSCLPTLPSVPEWNPYEWALTAWGGQMTDSEFGEAFFFSGKPRQENLFGIGINKKIYQNGPISFELEVDWLGHAAKRQAGGKYNQSVPNADTPEQSFGEAVLGVGVRLWLRPWLNFGFIEGISYTTSFSNYERTKREKYSKLLNYLGFEVEALLNDQLSLVGRIHHRSGAFGTFAGAEEGSNAYLVGFRYRFGKKEKNNINNKKVNEQYVCESSLSPLIDLPPSIDDDLANVELPKTESSFIHNFHNMVIRRETLIKNIYQTNASSLSVIEQEVNRAKAISSIDQNIFGIDYKDRFSIQAQFGIPRSLLNLDGGNQIGSISTSQIDKLRRAKLITGSITRWRIQTDKLNISDKGWDAKKISFTNDPLTPTQTRIEARNVVAEKQTNGDYLIRSSKSRLIIEERLRLPIVNSRRIKKAEQIENRWVLGVDAKDRDGLFLGYAMKPFRLGDNYNLSLRPHFLIQRFVKNETDSYIGDNSYVTSDKVKNSIEYSDLFGLRSKLRGKSFGWDVNLDSDISTFNLDRITNGSRYWGNLKKTISTNSLGQINTTLFGAYRYKSWNGSLGETDIYSSFGGYIEKKSDFKWKSTQNSYLIRIGAGKYQAEGFNTNDLYHLWRTNFYAGIDSQYYIWKAKELPFSNGISYRFTPKPVIPSVTFITKLSAAYSRYEDNSNQATLSLKAGPEFTLGRFRNKFFDYTKVSLLGGGTLKKGSSPFDFDQAIDLGTLGLGIKQQIYGPLVFSSDIEFNVDSSSDYYGQAINSNFELRWQRRAYDFGIFYNPYTGVGGFSFHLNDFNFSGIGRPFNSENN